MRIWNATIGQPSSSWLPQVTAELQRGQVVVIPTASYYGLAADSRSPEAMNRVLDLKQRAASAPLLLLAASVEQVRAFAPRADARLDTLAELFWPGLLTIVVPAPEALPAALVGPSNGVALRVDGSPIPRMVAASLGVPVTGTSANLAGEPPVCRAGDIAVDRARLAGVVDGGPTPGGPPSTLIDIGCTPARLLREGAVGRSKLREALDGRLV